MKIAPSEPVVAPPPPKVKAHWASDREDVTPIDEWAPSKSVQLDVKLGDYAGTSQPLVKQWQFDDGDSCSLPSTMAQRRLQGLNADGCH